MADVFVAFVTVMFGAFVMDIFVSLCVIVVFVAFVTDIFAALCDSCCHAPKLDYRNYLHLGVRDQGLDAKNINLPRSA